MNRINDRVYALLNNCPRLEFGEAPFVSDPLRLAFYHGLEFWAAHPIHDTGPDAPYHPQAVFVAAASSVTNARDFQGASLRKDPTPPDDDPERHSAMTWRYSLMIYDAQDSAGMRSGEGVVPAGSNVVLGIRGPDFLLETWGFRTAEMAILAATVCALYRDVLIVPRAVLRTAQEWEEGAHVGKLSHSIARLALESLTFDPPHGDSGDRRSIGAANDSRIATIAAITTLYTACCRLSPGFPTKPVALIDPNPEKLTGNQPPALLLRQMIDIQREQLAAFPALLMEAIFPDEAERSAEAAPRKKAQGRKDIPAPALYEFKRQIERKWYDSDPEPYLILMREAFDRLNDGQLHEILMFVRSLVKYSFKYGSLFRFDDKGQPVQMQGYRIAALLQALDSLYVASKPAELSSGEFFRLMMLCRIWLTPHNYQIVVKAFTELKGNDWRYAVMTAEEWKSEMEAGENAQ